MKQLTLAILSIIAIRFINIGGIIGFGLCLLCIALFWIFLWKFVTNKLKQ